MRNTFLALLLVVATNLLATEPPGFLNGFKFTVENKIDDNGESYEVYEIQDAQYDNFKKTVLGERVISRWVNRQGLLFVVRKVGDYEIMSARGFRFKRFHIYEAE